MTGFKVTPEHENEVEALANWFIQNLVKQIVDITEVSYIMNPGSPFDGHSFDLILN